MVTILSYIDSNFVMDYLLNETALATAAIYQKGGQ